MTTESRITAILTAPPDRLAAVDAILSGAAPGRPQSFKLLRMCQAVEATGLSRTTLFRAIRDGRLKAVEVRAGSFRVPETELQRFTQGRNAFTHEAAT